MGTRLRPAEVFIEKDAPGGSKVVHVHLPSTEYRGACYRGASVAVTCRGLRERQGPPSRARAKG